MLAHLKRSAGVVICDYMRIHSCAFHLLNSRRLYKDDIRPQLLSPHWPYCLEIKNIESQVKHQNKSGVIQKRRQLFLLNNYCKQIKFVTRLFWGTIDFHSRKKKYYGSQWCPRTALFPSFFRISSFVFSRTKTFIQVWNYLRVSKWQKFHFWVNYPFKGLLTQNISNTPYQSATNNNRWIYFQEKLTYGSMSITQIFPLAKTSLTASMLVP